MGDLSPEEGGTSVELIKGGRDIEVNATNVYTYVRKYSHYRMITCQEKALEHMKLGLFVVLPSGSLDSLTAEDFRLLLNGVGDINVQTLISYTSFNDESGESPDRLVNFKRWLWAIVERMTPLEKQDLVYFWTGSPALPASEDGFQPMPSVTIRPAGTATCPRPTRASRASTSRSTRARPSSGASSSSPSRRRTSDSSNNILSKQRRSELRCISR